MNFESIKAEAARTAHKVYGLGVTVTKENEKGEIVTKKKILFHKPKRNTMSPVEELKKNREAERKERVERLAHLVETAGDMAERDGLDRLALLEGENVCIASMISPPKYVSLADNKLEIFCQNL